MKAIFEGMVAPGGNPIKGPFEVEVFEEITWNHRSVFQARILPTKFVFRETKNRHSIPISRKSAAEVRILIEQLFEKKLKDWE